MNNVLTFRKMKPFKLWAEYQFGINNTSVKLIEKAVKLIDKTGSCSYDWSELKINTPPLSPLPNNNHL